MQWRKKEVWRLTKTNDLSLNLRMHGVPEVMLNGHIPHYDEFLEERRPLMSRKIKTWFEAL